MNADAIAAARDLLDRAVGPLGFEAAVGDRHYGSVWTRDAAITCLGALADGDDRWHGAVVTTLTSIGARASDVGQVPNTAWADGWHDYGEHASVDATAWWCLATLAAVQHGVPGSEELLPSVTGGLAWLRGLDLGGWGLVVQPGGADWMDSSLQRTGILLYTNALVVDALRRAEQVGIDRGGWRPADDVATVLDDLLWPRPGFDPAQVLAFLPAEVRARGFPHPATPRVLAEAAGRDRDCWASHLRWAHLVDVVDVLGVSLAVLAGVGDPQRRAVALSGLHRRRVADPFASRSLAQPVVADDPTGMFDAAADAAQDGRWRNPPWQYHNAGAWPMVGGFHAAAAAAAAHASAGDVVDALVAGCRDDEGAWIFPEWRDGRTGAPGATLGQTWSAAAILLAARPGAVWAAVPG